MTYTREDSVENYFVEQVEKAGGWAPKLTSPGTPGMPDRIVFWPGGGVELVETKAPSKGGTLRPSQKIVQRRLVEQYGAPVSNLHTRALVDDWLAKRWWTQWVARPRR